MATAKMRGDQPARNPANPTPVHLVDAPELIVDHEQFTALLEEYNAAATAFLANPEDDAEQERRYVAAHRAMSRARPSFAPSDNDEAMLAHIVDQLEALAERAAA